VQSPREVLAMIHCQCNHDPHWLKAEIEVGRYPQKYREVNGDYALFCVKCGGLWDHRATDRLIEATK
jgi:hypothetical protein